MSHFTPGNWVAVGKAVHSESGRGGIMEAYRYRWTHMETGASGICDWEGLTRQAFLYDLEDWNEEGKSGPHRWTYEEVEP